MTLTLRVFSSYNGGCKTSESINIRLWKQCDTSKDVDVVNVCMYVRVFMALITTLILCARSEDLVMSVSVRRVHVVLSTAGFKGGGKP